MAFKAKFDEILNDVKSITTIPAFTLSPAKKIVKKEGNSHKKDEKMKTRFLEAWNNIRYDFASDASLKKDIPIWILGVCHKSNDLDQELLDQEEEIKDEQLPVFGSKLAKQVFTDFASRPWFTYRKQFPPIEGTNITSDTGWGCMLRTAQMMIAQGLMFHHLGREWRWLQDCSKHKKHLHKNIIALFIDHPDCPLSVQCLSQVGRRFGNIPGNWYGPNTVAYIMQQAVNLPKYNVEEFEGVAVYVAQDCTVYSDDVYDLCGWTKDPDDNISQEPTSKPINKNNAEPDSVSTSSASSFVDEVGAEVCENNDYVVPTFTTEESIPTKKVVNNMIPMIELIPAFINPDAIIEETGTDRPKKSKSKLNQGINKTMGKSLKEANDVEGQDLLLKQNTTEIRTSNETNPTQIIYNSKDSDLNTPEAEPKNFTKFDSELNSDARSTIVQDDDSIGSKDTEQLEATHKSNSTIRDIFKDLPLRTSRNPQNVSQINSASSNKMKSNASSTEPRTHISSFFSSTSNVSKDAVSVERQEKDLSSSGSSPQVLTSTPIFAENTPNTSDIINPSTKPHVNFPKNLKTNLPSSCEKNKVQKPETPYSEFLFKETAYSKPSSHPLLRPQHSLESENKFTTFDSEGKPKNRTNPFSKRVRPKSFSHELTPDEHLDRFSSSPMSAEFPHHPPSGNLRKNSEISATSPTLHKPASAIILIPVRLGESTLNPLYIPYIQAMLSLESSIGIIGGKPKHSLYFVGYQDEHLLHLDPHYCQVADTPIGFKKNLHDYHTMNLRKTNVKKIDPSCCFGFYCKNQQEFEKFKEDGKAKHPKQPLSYPMFLIAEGRSGDHQFSPTTSDDPHGFETMAHEDLDMNMAPLTDEHTLQESATVNSQEALGASPALQSPQRTSKISSPKSGGKSPKKSTKSEGFSMDEMSAKLKKLIPDPSKFYPKFMRQRSSSPSSRKNKKEEESLESQFELL